MPLHHDVTQKLMTHSNYQFWALNLFGWAGYGFFVSLGAILWGEDLGVKLAYGAMATATGVLLSMGMRACYHRFWDFPPIQRGLYSLLVVMVATGLWSYLKMETLFELLDLINPENKKETSLSEYLSWYTYSFFILLSWAALYFGIKYYKMLQQEKQRTLKATSMAHEAQLKMLRYQLNPHFLFNTLNAISTLILESETKTANMMVVELSKFLRYSLENDPMQRIDLSQEIAALELYLNIEKVRFEERLKLDIIIDEEAKEALVPSLLLQPLVENSIKYAVSKNENGGAIKIEAKVFAGQLLIELCDDGPGITLVNGKLPDFSGVGLRNFRERLKEIYGINHNCTFGHCEPHGFKVNIRIPYETRNIKETS